MIRAEWGINRQKYRARGVLKNNHRDKSILLVEDDRLTQYLTCAKLKAMGLAVDVVSSGSAALEVLEQRMFDLVLLDIGLPDISGIEVCQTRREDERKMHFNRAFQRQTIITYSSSYSKIDCLAAGADFFVKKPLLPDELEALIRIAESSMCL